MKNFIIKNFKYFIFLLAVLLVWTACRNDDNEKISTSAPTIEFVAASVDQNGQPTNLSSINVGYANNTYVIRGTGFATLQHIYFNDYESSFNPNLVTDTNIIVTINQSTPYANVNNKLKLVTKYGTVEYDFTVAPPAPIVDGFQAINAADGDNIIIKGNYFVNPIVKVGETQATISASSLTQITAKLPAGSQGKKVSVTTLSGTATYTSQVGTSIYDDIFIGSVSNSTWAGDNYNIAYADDPKNIKQGDKAIKWEAKGWSAFQVDNSPNIPSNAKGIRFYLKGDKAGTGTLNLILNYSWGTVPVKDINNTYTYYEIPWSEFGLTSAPSTINIVFRNFSGDAFNVYIDDLGYYY